MEQNKFKNKYNVSSNRAKWNDYNYGTYFVTICTYDKEYFFGKIDYDEMELSQIGKYLDKIINEASEHNPELHIRNYVIMPNHLHLMVTLNKQNIPICNNNNSDNNMMCISRNRGRLSLIIGFIKRAVTKYANDSNLRFRWQTGFYDCIIFNSNEYQLFNKYIDSNLKNWVNDPLKRNDAYIK